MNDEKPRRPYSKVVTPWAIASNGMIVYRIVGRMRINYIVVDWMNGNHQTEHSIAVALDDEGRDGMVEYMAKSLEDPPRG